MGSRSVRSTSNSQLLRDVLLAVGAAILLLGLCYLRLWGDSTSAAFDLEAVDPQLLRFVGTALGANVRKVLAAQVLLHVALGLLVPGASHIAVFAWDARVTRAQWLIIEFILASCWLLAANASWFPLSAIGDPYAEVPLS